MKKAIISWILITSMILMQASVPYTENFAYGTDSEPYFAYGGASNWTGSSPMPGDSIFYVEASGLNLDSLEAEVVSYEYEGSTYVYKLIASQTNKWYLGKTASGQERYIYEMIVDSGGTLTDTSTVPPQYIRLKGEDDSYFYNYDALFYCFPANMFLETSKIPQEITTDTVIFPFDLSLSSLEGNIQKGNVSISLYSGTKNSPWSPPAISSLVGTSDDYEVILTGPGQYRVSGKLSIDGTISSKDQLYIEISCDGKKTYTNSPIHVVSPSETGQFKMTNAIAGRAAAHGGHHSPGNSYEAADSSAFYIGLPTTGSAVTAHRFTLTGGYLSSASQLSITDDKGTDVIRSASKSVSGPESGIYTASGMIDIPKEAEGIVFKYAGNTIHSVPVSHTAIRGGVSLTPMDAEIKGMSYTYPADTYSFKASLSGLNLPAGTGIYSALINNNVLGCSVHSSDGEIVLDITSTEPLNNSQYLSILMDGEELLNLSYDETDGLIPSSYASATVSFGDSWMETGETVMPPALTRISGSRDLVLHGKGFSSDKTYTAHFMEHTLNGLSAVPQQLTAVYVSSEKLAVSKELTDNMARGWYEVYVTENGTRLNGFGKAVLLPEEDVVQIINPTVKINNGSPYTTSPQVQISIDPGSFTQVRFSENQTDLSTMPYSDITSPISYTLSTGYGNKTIYFDFRNNEGKTYNTAASISYRTEAIDGPSLCGIVGITGTEPLLLYKDSDYTLYIQSQGSGYTSKVDITDSSDNILKTFTLNRTSSKDDMNTFSRRITFGDEGAAKLRFYFTDIYGINSDYTELSITVAEQPYILSCQTDISTGFSLGEYYTESGSEMKLKATGKAGLAGTAELIYKNAAGTEKILNISLAEDSYGEYKASAVVPADAAEIKSVSYKLTDLANPAAYAQKTDSKNIKVFASALFTGLPNTGDFDGKYLRIYNTGGISQSSAIESMKTQFAFNRLLPGHYIYSLFDSSNTYKNGEFDAQPGNNAVIDLSGVKKPASVRFNISVPEGGGLSPEAYVQFSYSFNDVNYYGYAKPNEAKYGLTQDMVINSYRLMLPYSDLKQYESPEAVTDPFILNEGINSIDLSVSPIKTIKVTVRATDINVPGRVIPGTSISVGQNVTNGSSYFYYSTSGTTNADGEAELVLYPGFKATFETSKQDYTYTIYFYDITDKDNQSFNIGMTYSSQNKLTVRSTAIPLTSSESNSGSLQALESGDSIASFSIRDTEGKSVSYYIYNNTITFMKNMYNQTVYIYPYMNAGYIKTNEYYTVKLDEYGNGAVEITAIQKGVITAEVSEENIGNTPSYMMIYNKSGYRAGLVNDAGGVLSSATCGLDDGNYTAVVFSGYGLTDFSGFNNINVFDTLGFIENEHYVKRNVDVETGKIKSLGKISLSSPVDKNMLFPYTVTFDSKFTPLSSDGKSGKIHVKYGINISNLLKDKLKLKNINIYTETRGALYDKIVNGYSSNFGSQAYTPDTEGNYSITFSADSIPENLKCRLYMVLTFEKDGKDTASYFLHSADTPQVSIVAPKQVSSSLSEVTVRGMAFAGSTVNIYDGEIKIGSVKANSQHSYTVPVTLTSPEVGAVHRLKAVMTTPEDEVFYSEEVSCEIFEDSKKASISNMEFRNTAHAKSLDDPSIKTYGVDTLGNVPGGAYVYAPFETSRVTFRINNLVSSQLENVYVINTNRNDRKTRFPAELVRDDPNGKYSDWKMEAVLGMDINNLSVFYSLKDGEDMGQLTGYRAPSEQQFKNALNNANKIEPAGIPSDFRNTDAAVVTEQTANSIKAYKPFGEGRIGIEVAYTNVSGLNAEQLMNQGFRKIPVGSSGEFYLIKDSSAENGYDIRVERTMYLTSGLAAAMTGSGLDANKGTPVADGPATAYASTSPVLYASTSDTVRNIAGKVDYAGYLQNTGEIAYEAFRNRTTDLGKLGTGMQVLGGAATIAQIFSGPASIDPANLRALVGNIKDDSVRSRLNDEILEYHNARRDSHTISSLMGTVSYGSGYFSLPGKCLSYIVSTGNMVYTEKIDAEYNIWGNGILSQIAMQLRKEEYEIGKEDDPDDPQWLIDPSGYVFEAVDSQRAEGVNATAQTDIYGDWAAWEDELLTASEQENPQKTDENGKYGWDVPSGNWRVLFEDESGRYQASMTKPMSVPPEHTRVNIGLISLENPEVTGVAADQSGIEIEFSKYMQGESLYDTDEKINNIQVSERLSGEIVPCGNIEFIAASGNTGYISGGIYQNDIISSEKFVKRIRFIADESRYPGGFKLFEDDGVTPKQYTVTVSENVLSYSGMKMADDYMGDTTASVRLTAAQPVSIQAGGKYPEGIAVSLSTETAGADIYYTTDGKTPTTSSFKYTKPIKLSESCNLKVIASRVGMNDSTVFSADFLIGDDTILAASRPVAVPPGGTYTGSRNVILTTSTEGAAIYYTLDGSTPSTSSMLYTEPVTISSSAVLKAIAVKSGYINSSVLNEVYVINSSGGGGSGSSPGGGSTVQQPQVPEIKGKIKFKDVSENDWFYNNVRFVVERGLFKGVTEDEFYPYSHMTRAMLVTVLYRMENPSGVQKVSFKDIEAGSWYEYAVSWSSQNKIAEGYGSGMFGPHDSITREQLAAMLYRYAQLKGYDTSALTGIESFGDYKDVSDWALAPIKWMTSNKLLNGRPGGIIDPGGYATRAEVAAILHRFIEFIE